MCEMTYTPWYVTTYQPKGQHASQCFPSILCTPCKHFHCLQGTQSIVEKAKRLVMSCCESYAIPWQLHKMRMKSAKNSHTHRQTETQAYTRTCIYDSNTKFMQQLGICNYSILRGFSKRFLTKIYHFHYVIYSFLQHWCIMKRPFVIILNFAFNILKLL